MTIRDMIRWDRPFSIPVIRRNKIGRSLTSLQNEMNRMFDDFFGDVSEPFWVAERTFPATDLIENEKNFKVRVELPGIDPENLDISISEGFCTIKGAKEEQKEEEGENYLRREVSYGTFQRTLALPEAANTEKADASFKNGILTIELPKKAESLHKLKKLQVKKAA